MAFTVMTPAKNLTIQEALMYTVNLFRLAQHCISLSHSLLSRFASLGLGLKLGLGSGLGLGLGLGSGLELEDRERSKGRHY